MKYAHIISAINRTPWMIVPGKLEQIVAFLHMKANGAEVSESEIRAAVGDRKVAPKPSGAVAVIPIYGIISQRLSMMDDISGGGSASCERISAALRTALNDDSVSAIVFDISSPGGTVHGVPELAEEIYAARGQKKMIAVANAQACSAAYYIGCAADELVVTPSGEVGSVGVYMAHADISAAMEKEGVKMTLISYGKHKTEGNPYEPLDEEAQAYFQSLVDISGDMFVKFVAKARGKKPSEVRAEFGEGRVVKAAAAVKAGMADRVATFDQVLQKLGVQRVPASRGASMEADTPAESTETIVPETLEQDSGDSIARAVELERHRLDLA